jgi:hypothetical protein
VTDAPYREKLDSNLERELLLYTLDTGSPLIRELKPLLFPIADNALQARQLAGECAKSLARVCVRLEKLEARDEKHADEQRDDAKRWKWWALGIVSTVVGVVGTLAGTLLAR